MLSEEDLERNLRLAVAVDRRDDAEVGTAQLDAWIVRVNRIGRIERLEPELERVPLGDMKFPVNAGVEVPGARIVQDVSSLVAPCVRGLGKEGSGVEPVRPGLLGCSGVGNGVRTVRTGRAVGPARSLAHRKRETRA